MHAIRHDPMLEAYRKGEGAALNPTVLAPSGEGADGSPAGVARCAA